MRRERGRWENEKGRRESERRREESKERYVPQTRSFPRFFDIR